MIELLFGVSVVVNILLIWYIIQLLKRYLAFQEELDYFVEKLEEYEGHIDIVNNLERFYGDETLANLLRHSKDLVKECKELKLIIQDDYEDKETESEEYAEEA
jgi:hypothetical protein